MVELGNSLLGLLIACLVGSSIGYLGSGLDVCLAGRLFNGLLDWLVCFLFV